MSESATINNIEQQQQLYIPFMNPFHEHEAQGVNIEPLSGFMFEIKCS